MTTCPIVLTGFGSVTALGPRRGLLATSAVEPQVVERWPTRARRCARLVPSFKPTEVVPGLKTRRFDRLSVWALVAASLALDDARFDPRAHGDCDRYGVMFGSALGCLDQTEEFMRSIARSGHAMADPILFPETLSNLPASHVARHFTLHGPNATLSEGALSGEAALLEAVGAIRGGEADLAVVMAGDELSHALFEWYGAAGVPFVPGEGLGAVVVETEEHAARRKATPYARLRSVQLTWQPREAVPASRDIVADTLGEFWSTGIVRLALTLGSLQGAAHQIVLSEAAAARGALSVALEVYEDSRR